jgi:hypothetical protein
VRPLKHGPEALRIESVHMFVTQLAPRILGSAAFWHRPPLSVTAHLALLGRGFSVLAGRVHHLHPAFAHVGLQGVVAQIGLELPPAPAAMATTAGAVRDG